MVQEFHVIRCFSCETFQVHQVKKSNKWNCKLCGAKQSIRKEYGRGSGADCRRHVQKLNMMRATLDTAPPPSDDQEDSQQEWQESTEDSTDPQYDYTDDGQKPSKWEKFVASTATDKTDDDQDPSDSEDTQFTTDKNRFQQRKRKGQGQSSQSYDRPGKRQRCQSAVPDVPARPSFAQTCATDWQLPTTQQENSPTFHEQSGSSNMNTSHNLWYRRQHHKNNIGGNTEPQSTAVHTTWQQKLQRTNFTRKIQNQDFTEGNTECENKAQPRWQQHSHTTNLTHSKVALSDTLKRKVEEREEVMFRNEESWKDVDANNDDRNVDRQMPNLARQERKGKRSITSSSGSSSRWSRFTSKTVDDDDDDEAEQVHVENYGSNQTNDSSSSKCDILSARFTANEGNVEQDSSLKEVLSSYSDDPAIEKCNHPMMAKPCSDPQGDVQTRMTGDVQTCEVSELKTGFCTGEDLDQVLGEDIWVL